MSNLKQNILKTLAYSDIFEFPLKLSEIYKFYNAKTPAAKKDIEEALKSMNEIVQKNGKYYYIKGRGKIITKRKIRKNDSEKKLQKARKVINILKKIPTVYLIAISGSLSQKNAGIDDDIDLFIISRKNTVWITRLLVTAILMSMGEKRKKSVKKAKDKICPNMIVSEKALTIPQNARNLYTAREITQLKIEYEKKEMGKRLLASNRWIKRLLPNTNIEVLDHTKSKGVSMGETYISLIDTVLFTIQKLYMGKITNEKVEKNIAKFHPNETSKNVLFIYKKRKNHLLNMYKMIDKSKNKKSSYMYN